MRKNTNANKNIRTNLRRNPQVCFVHPGYGNHGALNSTMRHRYLHSFFVFVSYSWKISLFSSIFYTKRSAVLSLYGVHVVRFSLLDGVFFY